MSLRRPGGAPLGVWVLGYLVGGGLTYALTENVSWPPVLEGLASVLLTGGTMVLFAAADIRRRGGNGGEARGRGR